LKDSQVVGIVNGDDKAANADGAEKMDVDGAPDSKSKRRLYMGTPELSTRHDGMEVGWL
jgi:hypothetical protein